MKNENMKAGPGKNIDFCRREGEGAGGATLYPNIYNNFFFM